jgi:hypothetical protein
MRFFRDFFTENLPVFLGVAGKSPRYADRRKGAQDARQRWLTPSARGREQKVVAENLPVTGARAPFNLSVQSLLIHASHESPPQEVFV